MSIHLRQLGVLTEVPTISRLYWIGLYERSNKWKSFFQVDLSPALVYCAKCMLAESEHTYITGHVMLVLTNKLTVLSTLFTFDRPILFSLLIPLAYLLHLNLSARYINILLDSVMLWLTLNLILGIIVTMIWLEICDRFVCIMLLALTCLDLLS